MFRAYGDPTVILRVPCVTLIEHLPKHKLCITYRSHHNITGSLCTPTAYLRQHESCITANLQCKKYRTIPNVYFSGIGEAKQVGLA
jgi:hypothetical protein